MKVVEITGGLKTTLPSMEYRLLKRIIDKNMTIIDSKKLTEKQIILCDSLVEYHVLDKEEDYYYLREVYL
ncbi:hypothetical protein PBI_SCTP2_10 [Salicola phage SCTP-2]|nr:hypothetical protein PBI_SCTP2_10 [Salicola phage SCTP-2]